MDDVFRDDVQHLFLDSSAPAIHDYMILDDLLPESLEVVRSIWLKAEPARRRQVVQSLVEIAEADIDADFGAFFRLALQDPDAGVRLLATEGLWEDEDSRLIAPLIHMLQQDPDEAVRAAAATSLARFVFLGEMEYLRPGETTKVQGALLDTIHNPEETVEVRRRAIEALSFADRDEIPGLISAAYQDPDERMRVSAVFAMGRSCDPVWTDTVVRELSNPDPAMRFEAARACGEIEAEIALTSLIQLLEDPDRQVREMAIWSLGEIGGERAHRALQRCLQDPDPGIQEAAEEALDELEFKESAGLVPFLDLDTFSIPDDEEWD